MCPVVYIMAPTPPKTKLLEIAVKTGKHLPVFKTLLLEGPHHDLEWTSTCFFDGQESWNIPRSKTKRAAEAGAAQGILDKINKIDNLSVVSASSNDAYGLPYISDSLPKPEPSASQIAPVSTISEKEPSEETSTLSADKICLVDLDNYDISSNILQCDGVSFLLFVSKTCTKPLAQYKASARCLIFVTPCVGKDATDVYMTYQAYGVRQSFPSADIAVVTRDHFGAILANIMQATYVCCDTDFGDWLHDRHPS